MLGNALAMTRRDASVNLWHMRQLAEAGEFEPALDLFRETLEVHPRLVEGLVPALLAMLPDERMRAPLAEMLDEDPFWELRFWRAVLPRRALLEPAAEIRLEQSTRTEGLEQFDRVYLTELVRRDRIADAFDYYRAIGGTPAGAGTNLLAERSSARGGRVLPIDWDTSSGGGIQVVIDEDRQSLAVQPILRGRGIAASRLVELPDSGSYRLVATVEEAPDFAVELQLRCASEGGRPLVLPLTGSGTGFSASFNVAGSACRAYRLSIELPRGAENANKALVFERIAIERVP
jgi:GNAT superfamily N-acetyltransferase